MLLPKQTEEEFTVRTGIEFTVIILVTDPVQAPLAAKTVYVVLTVGFAVTEVPLVALKPTAGDQVYVLPPLAVRVVGLPVQIIGLFTVGEIDPPTNTLTVLDPKQPKFDVPEIV